ncbi:hypothetical protein ACLIYM_17015 [Streptomyces fenghuangensis]|uniref:Uncharacterized protein n=1 Tax=Streptomyces chitinivorans TaxID=1257027 RepID=A0ABW7HXA0_9ACTN|nr:MULTISPECIES: hypothetical protein [Streptomyces]MCG3039412.1 hypothetical protein [Streptomyces sp. ICN903]MDH2407416.1 hypothetical protein [Streptomyces chitinivorans]
MDEFRVDVPWGVVRIEAIGSSLGIPEIDPLESPAEGNRECVVVAVVHGDIGPVDISVSLQDGEDEGTCVYDDVLRVLGEGVEVADLVGDDFSHRYDLPEGDASVRVCVDDPGEAQRVLIRIVAKA